MIHFAQALFFAAVCFVVYAYYVAHQENKIIRQRVEKGVYPESYGWSLVIDNLIGQYWAHESGMAQLMPSVTRQCYTLEVGHKEGDYIHFEKATQVDESGKLGTYIIPFPIMKEDLVKLEAIVNPDKPLKPVFLETYLQAEGAV